MMWRQCLQLSSPAPVRHFHPQNALREVEGTGTNRHSMTACQRPCQHGPMSGGRALQAAGNDSLQSGAGLFHGASHQCKYPQLKRVSSNLVGWVLILTFPEIFRLESLYFENSN